MTLQVGPFSFSVFAYLPLPLGIIHGVSEVITLIVLMGIHYFAKDKIVLINLQHKWTDRLSLMCASL